jgi:hypothetical protein
MGVRIPGRHGTGRSDRLRAPAFRMFVLVILAVALRRFALVCRHLVVRPPRRHILGAAIAVLPVVWTVIVVRSGHLRRWVSRPRGCGSWPSGSPGAATVCTGQYRETGRNAVPHRTCCSERDDPLTRVLLPLSRSAGCAWAANRRPERAPVCVREQRAPIPRCSLRVSASTGSSRATK